MKKNEILKKVKLLVITLILCISSTASTLFTGKTVNVNTEETKNNKISQQVLEEKSALQNLDNMENYHYTKTKEPEFLIKDVDGSISIKENVVISFEGTSIILPNFNYYRILDMNNETRFYQADTIVENETYGAFVYIGIFLPSIEVNEDHYVMYLQYGVEETLTLNNIKILLSELEFSYFASMAEPFVLGNDDLSERLKVSGKAYQNGAYEEKVAKEVPVMQPMAMNNIEPNSYDSYTNSNGIILDYVNTYFGKHELRDGTYTDDSIVQIVPKDLCFIPGEHFYVGKEYGFFIKVMTDHMSQWDYAVDIFVFDIQNVIPFFPSNPTGSTRITPLFQYRYKAADKDRRGGDWTNFDSNLTRIVFRHLEYDYAEYFMNDIGFRHSLINPTLLNPGDEGYNANADDGAFIIQTRYNSGGVGLKRKGGSFSNDTIIFGLGFVPYVSAAVNIYSYVYNLYEGFGSKEAYFYKEEISISDNEVNIDTYETNNTDQITVRKALIKSMTSTQKADIDKPRLIHVGGGYAECKYVVARASNSTYNKIQVVTSISANILEDNTSRFWLFGWREEGEVVNYGRATGTYYASNYQRMNDVKVSGQDSFDIKAGPEHKILKFAPSISGLYRFETISTNGDPNFSITDATTKVETPAIDDLDGANNRNARLDMQLTAGHIYYIDAFSYNSSYGYSLSVGYKPESSLSITRDSNNPCSVDKEAYKLYKFVPTTTGFYDIFTIKQSGDPYLFLFDSSGKKLKENDDGLGNLNSLITHYLYANTTYYIAIQGYKGLNAINSTLKITPSIVNCDKICLNEPSNILVASITYVFEFIAPYSGSFDFFTFNNTGDPFLELYDENRNMIAYNDDGEDDLNSLITYDLIGGHKYYLHVRAYNTTTASYEFSVRES